MKMHVLLGLLILGVLLLGCAAPPTGQQTYYGPGGTVTTTGNTTDYAIKFKECIPGTAFSWSGAGGGGSATGQYSIVGKTPDGLCQAKYTISGQSADGDSGSYSIDYFFSSDGKLVRTGQATSQ